MRRRNRTRMTPSMTQGWTRILATVIGLVVGYFNFRAAMTFFFIISNTDRPIVLIAILGYAALLPLTIVGYFYPARAAKILMGVTAAAFVCGLIPSPVLRAAIHMGSRFVLPNVVVAALFMAYGRFHRIASTSPATG
jgi:hypothetical protein